ncbi:unnamed protein product [Cyprideis torosa]|uniref:Uncharacterized protein n=1 Tax=Cyprideis torosa TaxID=163714 RepID=A0A7R8ZHJ3_9CRUS|nr:unnamed protein product [Cyprideis torosa]CAG0882628.1 unnamed protein product [Cyprideis torosa]
MSLGHWSEDRTSVGVPFFYRSLPYPPDNLEITWSPPTWSKVEKQLLQCNSIRYAAYRMASKILVLQATMRWSEVHFSVMISILDRHGLKPGLNLEIDCVSLEEILGDIFATIGSSRETAEAKLLTRHLVLSIYDRGRTGKIDAQGLQVLFSLLSSGPIYQKFRYLFLVMSGGSCQGQATRRSAASLLRDFALLAEFLKESLAFGLPMLAAAVESLCGGTNFLVTERGFLDWLSQEPQTLVWWPTVYRISSATSVTHPSVLCNVCGNSPIRGLRYHCLMCFSYNQCQSCFFRGETSPKHSLTHPVEEYCRRSTPFENGIGMAKKILNRTCFRGTCDAEYGRSGERYLMYQRDVERMEQELESFLVLPVEALPPSTRAVLRKCSMSTSSPSASSSSAKQQTSNSSCRTSGVEMDYEADSAGIDTQHLKAVISHLDAGNRCLLQKIKELPRTIPDYDKLVDCHKLIEYQMSQLRAFLREENPPTPILQQSEEAVQTKVVLGVGHDSSPVDEQDESVRSQSHHLRHESTPTATAAFTATHVGFPLSPIPYDETPQRHPEQNFSSALSNLKKAMTGLPSPPATPGNQLAAPLTKRCVSVIQVGEEDPMSIGNYSLTNLSCKYFQESSTAESDPLSFLNSSVTPSESHPQLTRINDELEGILTKIREIFPSRYSLADS